MREPAGVVETIRHAVRSCPCRHCRWVRRRRAYRVAGLVVGLVAMLAGLWTAVIAGAAALIDAGAGAPGSPGQAWAFYGGIAVTAAAAAAVAYCARWLR
jgi:hypothetical protein